MPGTPGAIGSICVNSDSYFFHLGHAPMLFPFFGVDQML